MAKGDDALAKKKNRARRKRLRGSEPVSARIAAVIAAKCRRKAGKRRMCEGMCYSLPTPEDPFNDRNDQKMKKNKKSVEKKNGKDKSQNSIKVGPQKQEDVKLPSDSTGNGGLQPKTGVDESSNCCPSKFLCHCLAAIQNAWKHESNKNDSDVEPLLASRWGFDFWKSFSDGSDILDLGAACASREQVAWLVCATTDIIARKEKEGLIPSSPFLLYLVNSQENAAKVRAICKPLKEFGVHTVSLHTGAPLAHQVHGLKSCEPEFLVSTPERLSDLVLLKAIDISEVSLLVVDGLEGFVSSGLEDKIRSIGGLLPESVQTMVFSKSRGKASSELLQSLIKEPISLLSLTESTTDG